MPWKNLPSWQGTNSRYSEGQVSGWSIVVIYQVEGASPMSPWRISNMPPLGELMCGWLVLAEEINSEEETINRGQQEGGMQSRGREGRDLSSIPWGWSQSHKPSRSHCRNPQNRPSRTVVPRVRPEGGGVARPSTPCSVGPALLDLRVFKRGQPDLLAGFLCETIWFSKIAYISNRFCSGFFWRPENETILLVKNNGEFSDVPTLSPGGEEETSTEKWS